MNKINKLLILVFLNSILTGCFPAVLVGGATGVAIAHDRRTSGTVIDDRGIELKGTNRIAKRDFYENSHINIDSFNGYVLLTGQVPTVAAKKIAGNEINDIEKVRKVFNELTVGKPTSITTRAKDSWITGTVKSYLIADSNIDPTRISVTTEDGIVFLMGLVTQDEALIATKNAQKVSGVKKIVRVFEYIEK